MSLRSGIPVAPAALLVVALAACGASAQGKAGRTSQSPAPVQATTASSTSAPSPAGAPCGPAAPEVLARTEGLVARRIYAGELSSSETRADRSQVERYTPLLSALASGDRAAVKAAVTSLVFSHTHVVRLRVTQGAAVLADVGGPYILAPVSGSLRFHGRSVGRYVFSVQDDLGYVKLETRFIGVPLVLRTGSHRVPVEGVLTPGPVSIPDHGPVSYRHARYEAFSFNASAFPSGALRISLLVPVRSSLAANTCAEIETAELGQIAQRVSRRFALSPANFPAYIKATGPLTGGLIYIRAGARLLAGSTRPGPPRLPAQGTVKYRGVTYSVSSFSAPTTVGPVRIYQLVVAKG
jgi:hypothetical protein